MLLPDWCLSCRDKLNCLTRKRTDIHRYFEPQLTLEGVILVSLAAEGGALSSKELTQNCNELGRLEGERKVKTALGKLRNSVPTGSVAVLIAVADGRHELSNSGADAMRAMPEQVRRSLPIPCREALP